MPAAGILDLGVSVAFPPKSLLNFEFTPLWFCVGAFYHPQKRALAPLLIEKRPFRRDCRRDCASPIPRRKSFGKGVIIASDTMIYGCAGLFVKNPPVARRRTCYSTKRLELPELTRSHCTLVTAVRKSQRTCAPRQRRRKLKGSEIASIVSASPPLKARYQLITHTFHSYSPVDTARLASISASPLDDRYYRKDGPIYTPHLSALDTARRGRTYLPKIDILREVGLSTLAK